MDGFTIIDGVVGLFIVLSALLAYSRGLVREALAIAGWVVAGILAFIFAPQVEPLVKEVPVVGEFIADSCELSMIGAFAAVFAVALIVASLITPLFSSLVQRSALGGIDQGLGFVFGVARGVLLEAVLRETARGVAPVVDHSLEQFKRLFGAAMAVHAAPGEIAEVAFPPGRADDLVAPRQRLFRKRTANAARHAGDENGRHDLPFD